MVEIAQELVEKEIAIIGLRQEGYVWREIAEQVGMSTAGVHKAYKRAMTREIVATIDEYRETEMERIDRLQRTYWQPAVEGNLRAAEFVMRCIKERSELLGLYAPLKVQAEVVTYDGTDLDREVERYARLIEAGAFVEGGPNTITELPYQSEQMGMETQVSAEGTITT